MLEIADDNTERLVRLVNNVLDLQRIEAGEVKMEKQACDGAELMISGRLMPCSRWRKQHQVSTRDSTCRNSTLGGLRLHRPSSDQFAQ